ncbi:MAG: hypothetical protein QOF58_310, partial [Pseudonocardiales bacterium]|nr:hypothetical protein [Pseudonocardiales bacterium]
MTGLVGRMVECENLVRLAQTSQDEGAQLALVRGPKGIGRSSLLAAVRRELREDDVTVLCTSGHPQIAEYGSVREMFEPLTARALPVLEATRQADDYAALCGLYRIAVDVMADRPLVVLLDDGTYRRTALMKHQGFECGDQERASPWCDYQAGV